MQIKTNLKHPYRDLNHLAVSTCSVEHEGYTIYFIVPEVALKDETAMQYYAKQAIRKFTPEKAANDEREYLAAKEWFASGKAEEIIEKMIQSRRSTCNEIKFYCSKLNL